MDVDLTQTLQNSLVFLAVLAGGFALKKCGVFKTEDARPLSKLVLTVTLPAAILKGSSGVELSGVLMLALACSIVLNVALLAVAALLSRRLPGRDRAVAVLNTNTFNFGNFAIPFLSGFVGQEAFAAMCMYDMGAAALTYGPNIALAQRVAGDQPQGSALKAMVKKLFSSVTFVTYLVVIVMSAMHWKLTGVLAGIVNMAGNANPFLAMLCIGILFDLKLPKAGRAVVARVLGGRYAVCTVTAVLLWCFFPGPAETVRTLVIMTFAPIASCAPILTVENGYDGTVAAIINSISMVLSIGIMIVLLMALPMPVRS